MLQNSQKLLCDALCFLFILLKNDGKRQKAGQSKFHFALITFRGAKWLISKKLHTEKGDHAMPTFLSEQDRRVELDIFDSYCKTIIRRVGKRAKEKRNLIRANEKTGTEVMDYVADTFGETDTYISEHIITDAHGHSCVITTDWLYQAIYNLPESEKEVLILKFWYGYSVRMIQAEMHISKRRVSHLKSVAFESIRKYYERNRDERT